MRKLYHLLALALFTTILPVANAKQISEQEAIKLVERFSKETVYMPKSVATHQTKVAYTATSESQSANLLYVIEYGNDGGFVIVAADDVVATPILGYTDNGSFDYDSIPDNLKWWIEEYGRLIEYAIVHDISTSSATALNGNVEPLISTRWNQYEPYNNLCPTINGQRAVTGCAATAMAQVMNYYEWPVTGTGRHSYEWQGMTLSADFGSTSYQWNLMDDIYDGSNSDAANTAVAELMYHCGVSLDMQYRPASMGGSGAFSDDVVPALTSYFGYAKDAVYLKRDYYSYNEWIEMVKAEIDASRPVYYSGQSTGGGHAFILDGYNPDGYFHVNWGWGGLSDGYYIIATLNPYDGQGAGSGSDSGFAYQQGAIFNLHRPNGDEDYVPLFYMNNLELFEYNGDKYMTADELNISKGSDAILGFNSIYNYGTATFNGYIGLYIENDAGNIVTSHLDEIAGLDPFWGYSIITSNITIPANIADGHYRIYPCCSLNGSDLISIKTHAMCTGYASVTVEGNNVNIVIEESGMGKISCNNITVFSNDKFANNETTTIYAEITNNGTDYYNSSIYFALHKHNTAESVYPTTYNYTTTYISVAPGETKTVNISQDITNLTLDQDLYDIIIMDANLGTPLQGTATINVNNPKLDIVEAQITDSNPASLTVTANFENRSSTDFSGTFCIYMADSGGNIIKTLDMLHAEIPSGSQSGLLTFNGSFSEGTLGDSYRILIFADSYEFGHIDYVMPETEPRLEVVGTPQVIDTNPENITISAIFKNLAPWRAYDGSVTASIYSMNGAGEYILEKTLDTQLLAIAAGGQSDETIFNGSFAEADKGTIYYIRLVDDNCQAVLSTIEYASPTGVGNIEVAIASVYPNPVTSTLHIDTATEIADVELYNIAGGKVAEYVGNGTCAMTIDMDRLPAATYLLRVATADEIIVEKIVKR